MAFGLGGLFVDDYGRPALVPQSVARPMPTATPFSFAGGAPLLGDQATAGLPPGTSGILPFGALPMPQPEPQAPGGLFSRPQAPGGSLSFAPGAPGSDLPLPPRAAAGAPRPQGAGIRPFGALPEPVVDASSVPPPGKFPGNPPFPPRRPAEFGSNSDDALGVTAAIGAPQGQAPGSEGPGFLDSFRSAVSPYSDLLMGLGVGLMTKRGIGPGIAAGVQYADQFSNSSAARDLASAKQAESAFKLRQQLGNSDQLAQLAMQKNPGMTMAQARAAVGNQSYANELLKGFVPPTEQFRQDTDPDGNIWKVNTRTGERTLALQAREDKTQTPLTDPAARLQAGIRPEDKRSAWLDANGKVTYEAGQPNTQVTVNTATSPILKGLGDQFVDSSDKARSAAEQVRAIHNARAQLDAPGGIVSGFRAGDRLSLQKVGALLGVADPGAIQNTEALRAALKPMVLEAVKGLGSNPSNGDRTFAEDFSGGNIALDEGSIRRILDLNERSARAKIDRHNTLSDSMLAAQPDLGAVKPLMRVEAPGAYSRQQARGSANDRFRQLQGSGLSRQEIFRRLQDEGY